MMLVVACSLGGQAATTIPLPVSSTTTATSTTTNSPPANTTTTVSTTTTLFMGDLADWEVRTVLVDGTELVVAVADDPGERAQGLMGVGDLGDLAGMLFVYEADSQVGFWMKDTVIPLDIAFFAADGSLVDVLLMEPCQSEPCPFYEANAPYRWALETPAGDLDGLGVDATLVIPEVDSLRSSPSAA